MSLDVWKRREDIIQTFPDMGRVFADIDKILDKPGCSSCRRRRQQRSILKRLASELDKNPQVDLEKIQDLVHFIDIYRGRAIKTDITTKSTIVPMKAIQEVQQKSDLFRKSCLECSLKHISQAYILLKESLQTYSDHVELADQHLQKALECAPNDKKDEIRQARELVRASMEEGNPSVWHIRRAELILRKVLGSMPGVSPDRWIAMGHLAEAADECVTDFPEFANEIREERLRLLDNPSYDVPFLRLISKARALLEAKKQQNNEGKQ